MNAVIDFEDYTKKGFTTYIKCDTLDTEDTFQVAELIEKRSKKVLPFDSEDEVNMVVTELANKSMRDMCLFVMGCNTQLRIGDLLEFRWKDVLDQNGNIKDEISKIEKKNRNLRHIYVNDAIKLAISLYRDSIGDVCYMDYMFTSQGPRKRFQTAISDGNIVLRSQPITEQLVSGAIRSATKRVGLWRENRRFSTHSMRKTGARAAAGYLTGRPLPDSLKMEAASIERVRGMLGHSNPSITARYIDLQDKFDKTVYLWMNLGIEALTDIKNDTR
ncbi:hypothetical protein B5G34_00385 [Flavonifractor sp. An82]|uniref:tyrosine-type recombinase/integrase n=1 Tax=Flavonifractor sp. An82 TaxID=1965660 RepID=UPI000B39ABB3|nr:tyrosine-type recombinase/integrase [Flavonifractor sp. An82]OUN23592.1 hypothetical protein B5G34_00385 [Flavonifractor sp. An82]